MNAKEGDATQHFPGLSGREALIYHRRWHIILSWDDVGVGTTAPDPLEVSEVVPSKDGTLLYFHCPAKVQPTLQPGGRLVVLMLLLISGVGPNPPNAEISNNNSTASVTTQNDDIILDGKELDKAVRFNDPAVLTFLDYIIRCIPRQHSE